MTSFFITGTDTDIGKTFVTSGLALAFRDLGYKVGVFKPLQSGAIRKGKELLAPDLEFIKQFVETKNSYLLEGEVSPFLASNMADVQISIEKIKNDFLEFSANKDIVLVEGAGGACCPIAKELLIGDLISFLDIPVILVAGAYLGTINHTLLTIKYLKSLKVDIRKIFINKFPKYTQDTAILNIESELKSFTELPVSIIEKQTSQVDLISVFKDYANRLIS